MEPRRPVASYHCQKATSGEMTMGDLLKGGLLWLLGVPLILVIVLFATGIL